MAGVHPPEWDAGTLAIGSPDRDHRHEARQPEGGQGRCGSRSSGTDPPRRRTSYESHKLLLRSFHEQRRLDGWPYGVAKGVRARGWRASCPLSGSSIGRLLRDPSAVRTKALHVTKDCSGYVGVAGNFWTIRSSNVKALMVGSKIFYMQPGGKTALTAIRPSTQGLVTSRPAIASSLRDLDRTVHDLGRHGNAGRVPGPCTCHGRCVDPRAVALGRDLQLQSRLDPVRNRPLSERVAGRLSSLSAKYIVAFALLVAVPVICTSAYSLTRRIGTTSARLPGCSRKRRSRSRSRSTSTSAT